MSIPPPVPRRPDQPPVPPPRPPADIYGHIANYIGRFVDQGSTNMILVESNESILDKIYMHPLNRDVDMTWVDQLMIPLQQAITRPDPEPLELTVGILDSDVHLLMEENNGADFKLAIIDGQHRTRALMKLAEQARESPDEIAIRFKVWVKVYILKDEEQLRKRIKQLNHQRVFTSDDVKNSQVREIFTKSLDKLLGEKFVNRRFAKSIRDSHRFLRDPKWTKPLFGKNEEWMMNKIREIADNPSMGYSSRISEVGSTTVLGQAIAATQLYQLVDTSHDWIGLIRPENEKPLVTPPSKKRARASR